MSFYVETWQNSSVTPIDRCYSICEDGQISRLDFVVIGSDPRILAYDAASLVSFYVPG